jgi:ABC-type uncharacterized transport system ATPase component
MQGDFEMTTTPEEYLGIWDTRLGTHRGLATALAEHSMEEGKAAAIRVAEHWRDALEDMMEQGNQEQRQAIRTLMSPITSWLIVNR